MNKQKIIDACKNANACEEEFERLISAKTDKEFEEVLQDNIEWVIEELSYNLIKDVPFEWDKLEGCDWSELLNKQPQFHIHCDWDKLNGFDWVYLLIERPQFHIHGDWDKFSGYDWSKLLIDQPKFAEYCDWSKLRDNDWYCLLKYQPQFKKYKLS